jgi:dipeptidase E
MRLFLSSQNLGNYPDRFVQLVGTNKKVALVENAKDDWSVKDRRAKLNEHLDQFKDLGLKVYELDLRKFFGKEKELQKVLSECGAIFLSGGNTFILARALRYSGTDKLLYDIVRKNEIAFGGSSAGSIIATPSLRGTELGDQPEVVPEGYKKEVLWEGLNFVSHYIVPHFKSDWFGKEAEAMKEYFKDHKLPYRALKDGQVLLVNAHQEEFLR